MTSQEKPVPRRTWRGWAGLIGGGVAIALIAGVLGGVAVYKLGDRPGRCDVERIADGLLPSIVTIATESRGGATGTGSGIIIRPDGKILTNDHVIAGSSSIQVVLDDGERLAATVVGTDPLTDLAVLDVKASKLPALPISWNEPIATGQAVVALGSPLGLSGTVTSGIISALNRDVSAPMAGGGTTVLVDSIQTDAAINPGNSGGALVTCDRRLIGVNTAISTVPNAQGVAGGGSVGIGFAVPATTAQRVTTELLAQGRATHPWLGLSVAEISQNTADTFGASAGLYVQAVNTGGPAAQAGVQVGDVIVTLNGQPASSRVLSHLLLTASLGDHVPATVIREGKRIDLTITVIEQPVSNR
jgi:putative serine protease PepD